MQTFKLYDYNFHEAKCMLNSVLHSAAAAARSLQSCPTLCDPLDGSPPGSSVPGILQARTLEWFAISSESEIWMGVVPTTNCPQTPKFPRSKIIEAFNVLNQMTD